MLRGARGATAEATGKYRRPVERAAARGEALGDDLAAVAGTSLDKGVEVGASANVHCRAFAISLIRG